MDSSLPINTINAMPKESDTYLNKQGVPCVACLFWNAKKEKYYLKEVIFNDHIWFPYGEYWCPGLIVPDDYVEGLHG